MLLAPWILALCVSAASAATFTDSTFSGWTTQVYVKVPPMPPPSALIALVQGVRQVTQHYVSGQAIYAAHLKVAAVYDPGVSSVTGAVHTSYKIKDKNKGVQNVAYAPLVFQANEFYAPVWDKTADTFTTVNRSLTASSFNLVKADGTFDSTRHPDFTCTGERITFGYLTGNSDPGTQTSNVLFSTVSLLDNWSVSFATSQCT